MAAAVDSVPDRDGSSGILSPVRAATPLCSRISGVTFRISSYLRFGQLWRQNWMYPFLLKIILPSSVSSESCWQSFKQGIFSKSDILLFDKKVLWSRGQWFRPLTYSITFLLRFSSVNEMSPLRLSTDLMRLFARFNTLNSAKWLMFSILPILFECRSSTSSFVRFYKFFICLI